MEQILSLIEQYGYLVVFFGVMLESMGVPLPGETILIASGVLAQQGHLDVEAAIVFGIVGAHAIRRSDTFNDDAYFAVEDSAGLDPAAKERILELLREEGRRAAKEAEWYAAALERGAAEPDVE